LTNSANFLLQALTIFGVNIVLSGDNGVLIAMAVTALPKTQKMRAIAIGASLAVVFQVIATFFAIRLLHIRFLQLAGGLLILWIAVNLFKANETEQAEEAGRHGFWKAIWFIVVADLTMSTDNILAVAAIAKGDIILLSLGLGLSIVVVVFASGFLSFLIEKYPLIIYAGAAILGNVGGEMIVTDAFTADVLNPGPVLRYCVQAAGAVGVVGTGYLLQRRRAIAAASQGPA
jgi:YjbE family integral membrane protein